MIADYTLNHHVLNTIQKSSSLTHLKQLQAFLIAHGHGKTQFFVFKLIRFCTLTLENLHYARFIFDQIRSPNIFLYTAMITAYASQNDHISSFLLYRNMVRGIHPKPNQFIYPHVLKSTPNDTGSNTVHAHVIRCGFARHPVVQTSLVDYYSRSVCSIYAARRLFDEISDKNVVSWTAMVSGYLKHGEFRHALDLFDEMPERDTASWTAVIAGCNQNGLFSEAVSIFKRMISLTRIDGFGTVTPNQVTLVSALSACGHGGMLQLGKSLHGYISRNEFGEDEFITNALVDMYGKCGSLRQARIIFDKAHLKSLTSWNSMINCLALHGQCRTAIELFDDMLRMNGARPDEVTYIGLLNACSHGGLVEEGRRYFDLMRTAGGIRPRIEHYGCVIDLLCRAGWFDEAMELVDQMDVEPDEAVWGSLLNGCMIHGRMELAELVVKKLIEMDPRNGGYWMMLRDIHGNLGKEDEAWKVKRMAGEGGAYKTPGCSWIELDNEVRQFRSADRSHPQSDRIYSMLDCLFPS